MTRFTFAAVQEYATQNGYEVVRTSEGYSFYPCDGNLAERMGGYKAKTLNIVIDAIKQGYGLHGQCCELTTKEEKMIGDRQSTDDETAIDSQIPFAHPNAVAPITLVGRRVEDLDGSQWSIDTLYSSRFTCTLLQTGESIECPAIEVVRSLALKMSRIMHPAECATELIEELTDMYDCDFCREEGITVPLCRLLPNYIVDFFLLAFDIKLTATVIELYCAEISGECDKRSIEHPEIKPDLIGTAALYLGFDANDVFCHCFLGYADDMPESWFTCLNTCINTIQPIINGNAFELLTDEPQLDNQPDWFCDAIDMFSESEEDFNIRIILEEIFRSPEVLEPIYWDASKNTLATEEELQERLNKLMGRKAGSKGRGSGGGYYSYDTEHIGLDLDLM